MVSKAVIRLAWMRLGVPPELIEWLVDLDMDARVSVRTLWTVGVWESDGLAGFAKESGTDDPFTFNPERGTGQGDISSPHTWVAVFDILLRALEEVKSEPFLLDCTGGGMYPAPEVGYADDLISHGLTTGASGQSRYGLGVLSAPWSHDRLSEAPRLQSGLDLRLTQHHP